MTLIEPDEVISQLKTRGVNICRRTLLRWEKKGYIPEPWVRNSRRTLYVEPIVDIVAEVYKELHSAEYWKDRALRAESDLERSNGKAEIGAAALKAHTGICSIGFLMTKECENCNAYDFCKLAREA